MKPSIALGACLSFAVSLAAQGAVGPGVVRGARKTPGLSPAKVGVSSIIQIHTVRQPGDVPGTWTCAMTVRGLPSNLGGRGRMDVLIGKYDSVNDRFTPGTQAALCNTPGDEFGLMLEPSSTLAVFERFSGNTSTVFLARRSAPNKQFGAPAALKGLPTQDYFDPAIGRVKGDTCLFYRLGDSLYYSPIYIGTHTVSRDRTLVVEPVRAGGGTNSPTPIFGANGEVTGLSHHEKVGNDNDHYLTLDLDPDTPSLSVLDTPTWINNGGFTGGTFFSAQNSPSPYHVIDLQTVWMSGTEAGIGKVAQLDFYAPPQPSGPARFAALMLSTSFLPTGIKIPSVGNALGLNTLGLMLMPVGAFNGWTGRASTAFPIPNVRGLLGAVIPAQGLTFDQNLSMTFTNTSSLRVDVAAARRRFSFPYDGRDHLLAHHDFKNPIVMRLSADSPYPLTFLAKDKAGKDIASSITLLRPGKRVLLFYANAGSYVARMPKQAGQSALGDISDTPTISGDEDIDKGCDGTVQWDLAKSNSAKAKWSIDVRTKINRNTASGCDVVVQVAKYNAATGKYDNVVKSQKVGNRQGWPKKGHTLEYDNCEGDDIQIQVSCCDAGENRCRFQLRGWAVLCPL